MDQIWNYERSSVIMLAIKTDGQVAIESGNKSVPRMDVSLPVQEQRARLFEKWLVELEGSTVYVLETLRECPGSSVVISFQKPAEVELVFRGDAGGSGGLKDVVCVVIRDELILVRQPDRSAAPEPARKPAPQKDALQKLQDQIAALAGEKQALEDQLHQEQKKSAALEQSLGGKLDTLCSQLSDQLDLLDETTRRKREALEALQGKIDLAEKSLEDSDRQRAELEKREKALKGQEEAQQRLEEQLRLREEAADANIQALRERIEELDLRLGVDRDTAKMLETDRAFAGSSVLQMLEQSEALLERAEKRLGRIAEFRERFIDRLETVVNGEGTLPVSEETGVLRQES